MLQVAAQHASVEMSSQTADRPRHWIGLLSSQGCLMYLGTCPLKVILTFVLRGRASEIGDEKPRARNLRVYRGMQNSSKLKRCHEKSFPCHCFSISIRLSFISYEP